MADTENNFALSPKAKALLQAAVEKRTGSFNENEIIERALSLFITAVDEIRSNRPVGSIKYSNADLLYEFHGIVGDGPIFIDSR